MICQIEIYGRRSLICHEKSKSHRKTKKQYNLIERTDFVLDKIRLESDLRIKMLKKLLEAEKSEKQLLIRKSHTKKHLENDLDRSNERLMKIISLICILKQPDEIKTK